MDGWDWDSINVISGEWWLLIIGLLVLLAGLGAGYLWGRRDAERRGLVPPPPPGEVYP